VSAIANVAVVVDARGASASLRGLQTQARTTQRAFDGLVGTAARLTAAFSGLQAIRFIFGKAADIQTQAKGLEVLTGSATKAAKIIKELQELGAVTPFTSAELITSAKRLQAFGVQTSKVVATTRQLADVSGATGAELAGIVTAFGQVIAKGRLQGEELLQFQERGVALQEQLKNQLGLTGEEFSKQLSKGQIAAEEVIKAFENLTRSGGKYADGAIAQSDTLRGRLSTLQDAVERLAQQIGLVLEPALKGVLNLAIVVVEKFGGLLAIIGGVTAAVYALNVALVRFAGIGVAAILAKIGGGLVTVTTGYTAAGAAITSTNLVITKSTVAFGALKLAMAALPFAAVAAGVVLIINRFRQAQDETDAFFLQLAEKGLEQAEASLERVQKNKKRDDLASARATQEGKIASILRGQLATTVSLATQEQLRLNLARTRFDNQLTVANAMYGALLKVNDLEMQRAQNAGNTQKQYQLQLQRAELIYKQSVLQIQSEIRKAELGALQVKIEFQKLKAATLAKAAKSEATQADFDALALQQQAVELAYQGVDAAKQAAMFHMQGADAIRQMTVEQAKFNATQRAGAAGAAGTTGSAGRVGGGRGLNIVGAGPQTELSLALAQRGVTGTLSIGQARATLSAIREQQRQQYIAAQGGRQVTGIELSRQGFAQGGYVTRPTNALIGEAGESEYVIPASKMNRAMQRYSAGVRGEAVTAGAVGAGSTTNANYSSQQNMYYGGGGASVNITTGPVIRMDNRDYVTMADMQRGMAAAANAGQANIMRQMQRSYTARRSMGL